MPLHIDTNLSPWLVGEAVILPLGGWDTDALAMNSGFPCNRQVILLPYLYLLTETLEPGFCFWALLFLEGTGAFSLTPLSMPGILIILIALAN